MVEGKGDCWESTVKRHRLQTPFLQRRQCLGETMEQREPCPNPDIREQLPSIAKRLLLYILALQLYRLGAAYAITSFCLGYIFDFSNTGSRRLH
ncbi:hypothetical protein ACU8OS_35220 (plasmid) [Rhizobium leguminosarum]